MDGVTRVFKPEVCSCCGAGPHNDNEHGGDCLINLKSADLIPYWNTGWNARVQAGGDDFPLPKHLSGDALVAWGMGMACAAQMLRLISTVQLRTNVHRWTEAKTA